MGFIVISYAIIIKKFIKCYQGGERSKGQKGFETALQDDSSVQYRMARMDDAKSELGLRNVSARGLLRDVLLHIRRRRREQSYLRQLGLSPCVVHVRSNNGE